jgi:hypothetical protein
LVYFYRLLLLPTYRMCFELYRIHPHFSQP